MPQLRNEGLFRVALFRVAHAFQALYRHYRHGIGCVVVLSMGGVHRKSQPRQLPL